MKTSLATFPCKNCQIECQYCMLPLEWKENFTKVFKDYISWLKSMEAEDLYHHLHEGLIEKEILRK